MANVREWYLGGMVGEARVCSRKSVKAEKSVSAIDENEVKAEDQYEITAEIANLLNSILADEFLAFITYKMCMVAMKGNKQHNLEEIAGDNGKDELDDHFKNLADWMQSKGVRVVTSVEEMGRITNCTKFMIFDGIDTAQTVDILIKSEEEAIAVYEKALDNYDVKYDLRTMLSGFLQDEREHLKKLSDIKAEMNVK